MAVSRQLKANWTLGSWCGANWSEFCYWDKSV